MKSALRLVDAKVMSSATKPPETSSHSAHDSISAQTEAAAGTDQLGSDDTAETVHQLIEQEVSSFISEDPKADPDSKVPSITESQLPTSEKSAEPGPAEEPALPASGSVPRPSLARRLTSAPFRAVLGIIVLLDLPFSFLGSTVKTLIGFVAVGTALMAAGIWTYGPKLAAALPAAAPPAQDSVESSSSHKKPEKPAEGEAEKKSEKKSEKKAEGKSEKKAEGKPEKKAEKGEKKAEPKEEKKPEAKPEKKAEKPAKSKKASGEKAEKKPESKSEKKSESKSEGKSEKKAEKKPHGAHE